MQPVFRTLEVIRALAQANNGLTLQQLSTKLDVPIASLHRIMAILDQEEYVTRSPINRLYFLGPAAACVGAGLKRRQSIVGIAYEILRDLVNDAGYTVIVAERQDRCVICSLRLDPRQIKSAAQLSYSIGGRIPWHACPAARALLIDQGEHLARRTLSGQEFILFTERTPRSMNEVWSRVEKDRGRGYCVGYGEWDSETWTLAAPVRDGANEIIAAVAVAGAATELLSARERARIRDLVLASAAMISSEIGNPKAVHQRLLLSPRT